MPKLMQHFARSESGATAIEYALIAGLIFLVIVTTVQALGTKMNALYMTIQGALPS